MSDLIPCLTIKNEEYYIGAIIYQLQLAGFQNILVADTGSTDETIKIVKQSGAELLNFGPVHVNDFSNVRNELAKRASMYGGWVFQVDGDEIYFPAAAQFVRESGMPHGSEIGFTKMITLDPESGTVAWETTDEFSRLAVYRTSTRHVGEYPFDRPENWDKMTDKFFYFGEYPDGEKNHRIHGYHLHRCERSSRDGQVVLRTSKRKMASMKPQTIERTEKRVWVPVFTSGELIRDLFVPLPEGIQYFHSGLLLW